MTAHTATTKTAKNFQVLGPQSFANVKPLLRPTGSAGVKRRPRIGFSGTTKVSPFGCWQFWVTSIFDVTHVVPHNLRPCATATYSWTVRKLRKSPPLSVELAESESLQKLFAGIRGQSGFRERACDVCHRCVYSFVYMG